ncbi:MAG: MFS transporter [Bacteroidales bacterium]|nr:MFS transporter [Bacteroidales bacterium]
MNLESQDSAHYDGLPMPRRVYSIVAITLGLFSSMMNSTIANVALPTIGANLCITEADSIWIINVYQIATLIFLLPFSSLGEIYSYKKVLLSGLVIFTSASFFCAFSTSFMMLIGFRILQGFGSAAMVSVNMSLIRLTYPKRFLGQGIGLNSTFVAISSVAGPAIASAVMSFTTWQWLFALNVPLGALAVVFGVWALPENPVRARNRAFPKLDAVLNGLFFGSFLLSFEAVTHSFPMWMTVTLFTLVLILGIIYIPRQLRQEAPLLPFDLIRVPVFGISVVASITSFVAQMTTITALPFYLQHQMGYTPSEAGVLFMAWPLVIMCTAPLSGFLMRKIHAGILGGFGQLLIIIGLVLLATVPADASAPGIFLRIMLCGAGFGLFQSPNNSIIMSVAPPSRTGSASGMLATSRLIGQTTGAMLVALMFNLFGADGPRYAIGGAAAVAAVACLLSLSRSGMDLPSEIRK